MPLPNGIPLPVLPSILMDGTWFLLVYPSCFTNFSINFTNPTVKPEYGQPGCCGEMGLPRLGLRRSSSKLHSATNALGGCGITLLPYGNKGRLHMSFCSNVLLRVQGE